MTHKWYLVLAFVAGAAVAVGIMTIGQRMTRWNGTWYSGEDYIHRSDTYRTREACDVWGRMMILNEGESGWSVCRKNCADTLYGKGCSEEFEMRKP